jgi:hypothetical protein
LGFPPLIAPSGDKCVAEYPAAGQKKGRLQGGLSPIDFGVAQAIEVFAF